MYYLRTRSAAPPIQFTVDQKVVQQVKEEKEQQMKMAEVNGEQQAEVEEAMQEGQSEGAVPLVNGKIDTESQAYKEALLACSLNNREACTMCSA